MGTGGVLDVCVGCSGVSGVGGAWVDGLDDDLEGWCGVMSM